MQTFTSLITSRSSCRNFSEQKLKQEEVTEIISAATWVPSGSNNQPWHFVVITDREKLRSYSEAAKTAWLATLDNNPHMHQYAEYIRDPEYNIFYNAPALVIIYGNRESYWHVYDCSMVAYNMHLLAEDQGLGCCWIGLAHNILSEPAVKRGLGVPEQYNLVAPVILGHPAQPKSFASNPNPRKNFAINWF
jgi:nitroreductase